MIFWGFGRVLHHGKVHVVALLIEIMSNMHCTRLRPLEKSKSMIIKQNIKVPMPDGVELAADVFLPEDTSVSAWPTILIRTPYDKSLMPFNKELVTCEGYALVIQDTRGRFESDGTFSPLLDEETDGKATIEWLCEQSWCDGKIGMAGGSYVGATQWLPALAQPKGLVSAMPQVTGNVENGFMFFTRGVVQLDVFLLWSAALADEENRRQNREYSDQHPYLKALRDEASDLLPLMIESMTAEPNSPEHSEALLKLGELAQNVTDKTSNFLAQPLSDCAAQVAEYAPWIDEWLKHLEQPDAPFWRSFNWEGKQNEITIPMLHMAAWHDLFIRGQLKDFEALTSTDKREGKPFQKLIVMPEIHTSIGTPDIIPVGEKVFSVDYSTDLYGLHKTPADQKGELLRRWNRHFLKDTESGLTEEAPITLFVQGEEVWRDEYEWPLARTEWTPLYLHSEGRANSVVGDGRLSFDTPTANTAPTDKFMYDPAKPVIARGGTFLNMGIAPGIFEQSSIEERDDVLVYTTEPLATDLEVTGPVSLVLWACTSAVDTDFTAKLVAVDENGLAQNICDGVTRLRFRREKPGLVTPLEIQKVEIELSPTSFVFSKGQRVRLQVSSSNFPLFDPNPNTGKSLLTDPNNEMVIAQQTIYHDPAHMSHLVLPVIPRAA